MQRWRFIDSGSNCGPENMALDETLLHTFDSSSSLPVFRLYGWSPPALSLGRFQKASDVLDLDRCRAAGVLVVRRITGGGVIYHADELTYSIVCSQQNIAASKSIKDSFRVLTGFLLEFYRGLGLDAVYAVDGALKGEAFGERTDYCFAGKETFDVVIGGRKIGGNAQRRTRQFVFQHGSIPLLNRAEEGIRFLRKRPVMGMGGRITSLTDEGITPELEMLKSRLKAAFCSSLDVDLVNIPATGVEREYVGRLVKDKYMDDGWNVRGEVF
jgi:lipoate-protein ligase A